MQASDNHFGAVILEKAPLSYSYQQHALSPEAYLVFLGSSPPFNLISPPDFLEHALTVYFQFILFHCKHIISEIS